MATQLSRSGVWSPHCGAKGVPSPRVAAAAPRRRAPATRAAPSAGPAAPEDVLGLSALRFVKPSVADIEGLVAGQFSTRGFNHGDAGASASAPALPPAVQSGGYMITTNRRRIGSGRDTFDAAVKAIREWEQLQLGWNFTTKPPVAPGTKICSATQTVIPWSVLPAQVVYSQEDAADFGGGDKGRRYAVGLASLSGHLLAGEERFSVELHADGSVWYDVFLFSKPNTLLAWASLPIIKLMQVRYVNDSLSALAKAVGAA